MKRFFLIIIACSLFATKGLSQQQQANENPNAPEITFDKVIQDFGTVPLDGLVEYEFTFTNTGREPLIIHACQSTCGCTVPACPREPIAPGEKGSIRVRYTTTNIPGQFNRFFTVVSNARNQSVRLNIKGEIVRPEATTAAN